MASEQSASYHWEGGMTAQEQIRSTTGATADNASDCPIQSSNWGKIVHWNDFFLAITALLVVSLCANAYRWWLKWNRPGPKSWPLIGCMPSLLSNWDRFFDFQLQFFERHGCFWMSTALAVDGLFIAEPSLVEYMVKTNFGNYPKGPTVTPYMEELLGSGIFNADHDQWKVQRKVASLEFAPAKLRHYNTIVYKNSALSLLRVLSQSAGSDRVLDLQDLFMRMTLDSTGKLGFGVELGCLSPALPAIPFATAFDRANELCFHRYVDPLWKIKQFLNVGEERELRKCLKVMDTFSYDVIRNRREEMKASYDLGELEATPDLLSRFMSLRTENKEFYSDQALRDVVLNFIIAGRDTSALTLSWFCYKLCLHPEVVEKALAELKTLEQEDDTHGVYKTSDDHYERFAKLLTFQNLEKLQYLQAALSETLRLYPAVPLEGKTALNDDVLPDGTRVKKGNMVSYSAYAMGRLKRVWGPDAQEFKPERWLKDGVFQAESPFKFVSFHAGPRACVGKESAFLQMKIASALVVRFFKFQLVPDHEVTYRVMFVLSMSKGLKVKVSLR